MKVKNVKWVTFVRDLFSGKTSLVSESTRMLSLYMLMKMVELLAFLNFLQEDFGTILANIVRT